MDVVRRKHLTQRALTDLEEVVLDVLFEHDPTSLPPSTISLLIGVPVSEGGGYHTVNDTLNRLESKGLVRREYPDKPGRILTKKGIERQKAD